MACAQYADDVWALLPSLAALPVFLAAMRVFGAAAGQLLNEAKSQAMLIGGAVLPDDAPPCVLRLVREATSLGICFKEGVQAPSADWPARVADVMQRMRKLVALPLSAFGRGLGSAAYGVSKLLYHAEFLGLPPADTLDALQRAMAAAVERSVDPAAPVRRFAGVSAPLLVGSPALGGFGVCRCANMS